MKKTSYLGVALFLIIALAAPAWSQARGQTPAQPTRAEYDAYVLFFNEPDPQKKVTLGEKFLTDYPNTQYKKDSYLLLLKAYGAAANCAKTAEVTDRMANVAGVQVANRVNGYVAAMDCAQGKGDVDKTVEYGDKALGLDAGNLNALLVLATTIPERLPTAEAAKQAALTKSEDLANKAIAGVNGLGNAITPAQKDDLMGQLHSSLGLIHLTRMSYDKATIEYLESIKTTPKDWVARYRLGLAYRAQMAEKGKPYQEAVDVENEAKKNKAEQVVLDDLAAKRQGMEVMIRDLRDKAIEQFAFAVAIGAAQAAPARTELEKLYQQKNGSLDGIDALISQKKGELGSGQ